MDITSGTPDQLIVNSYLIKIFQQLDAFRYGQDNLKKFKLRIKMERKGDLGRSEYFKNC